MIFYLLALLIGIVAGLRAMAPPALVAWAAHLGWLDLSGSWLDFLANTWVRWILTLLAISSWLRISSLPRPAARCRSNSARASRRERSVAPR
jgi:uncharacterized membrane protein